MRKMGWLLIGGLFVSASSLAANNITAQFNNSTRYTGVFQSYTVGGVTVMAPGGSGAINPSYAHGGQSQFAIPSSTIGPAEVTYAFQDANGFGVAACKFSLTSSNASCNGKALMVTAQATGKGVVYYINRGNY